MNELLSHAISNLEKAAIKHAGLFLADSHHGYLIWITNAGFTMQAELDPLTMEPVPCTDPEDQFYAEGAVLHLSTNEASMRCVYHPLHIVEAGEYFSKWASDLKLYGELSDCRKCA